MSANSDGSGKDRKLREDKKALEAARDQAATPAAPPREDESPESSAQPEQSQSNQPAGNEPTRAKTQAQPDTGKQQALGDRGDYREAYRNSQEHVRKLQSKYSTLEGKYKSEVGRLQKENRSLKQQLESGGSVDDSKSNGSLESALRNSDQYKRVAKEWDEETAEDFMGMVNLAIQSQTPAAPSHETVDEPDVDLGPSSHDEYMDALDTAVPGWDLKYNENSAFNSWAGSNVEPLSGRTYLEVLRHAAEVTHDIEVARRVFSAFDRAQAGQTKPDPTPEIYTEPSGAGGDGRTQPTAPTFREGDLREMEKKYRSGKVSPEDLKKFQQDYMQAYREGRLQPSQ